LETFSPFSRAASAAREVGLYLRVLFAGGIILYNEMWKKGAKESLPPK
jgi:hypothetical protein